LDSAVAFLIAGTGLTFTGFFLLCLVSFFDSLIAGALGLGGGVLVLSTMASLLPPMALVPIHGVVQLGSNLRRAVLSWRQTTMSMVTPFFIVTTIVTMFVGGTVVLVGSFVAPACPERHQFASTHSVVMTIQHGLKILTVMLLGFAFGPYIALFIGLVSCSFIGSYAGKLLLNRLSERIFRAALEATLTVLALQLLFSASRAASDGAHLQKSA